MKLEKIKINKIFDDNAQSFIIYDESSHMFYKKPTWTYSKYAATKLTTTEADNEIRVINDMYNVLKYTLYSSNPYPFPIQR
jgi:hypothetical protein